jgi:hypothetical protein
VVELLPPLSPEEATQRLRSIEPSRERCAVWIAAGIVVGRIDRASRVRSVISMRRDVRAGSIAADPASSTVWIGNKPSAVTE